ncbi:hypothetical protein LPB137_10050 [Poseidonibacter parvus]|uniref:Response regulatory domain-containing protein n=1 Tax=Poseidonibacter parvus TaxID=1850254 RepID=A0A1P8KNK6_9BACT|nr:response regulator [Poseidonibacter parvus]APW66174.1 hypothetical protein LPB137_10050 [Poseidonibacter parvus]
MSGSFEDIVILIAESDEDDRKKLFNILSKYFNVILEANDGKEAYELYKKNKIDIIISSDELPAISGVDLLKLIRLSDTNIGFIITSKEVEASVLLELIDLNVNAFLSKPISQGKLLEKIDLLSERILLKKKLLIKDNEVENYISAVDKVALIYKMKANGAITYMNESMLLMSGYGKDEIRNLNFKDIIHPEIPSKYIKETWDYLKDGKLWKGNTKFLSKNKEVFYLNNSIFKIEDNNNEEFITISFLTTKENLEKRDFQKKVILNIKEANKKEQLLHKDISKLKEELLNSKRIINNFNQVTVDELNTKILRQDNQLRKYEKDIATFDEKYSTMLMNKKSEIEMHVNALQLHKVKIDKQVEDIITLTKEVDTSHEKIKSLIKDLEIKNKKIIDLMFIIDENNIK